MEKNNFKEPTDAWFKDLKNNRKEFGNVENMIESAKFKYERELEIPKWVIGVSLTILLAVGFSNILISDAAPSYLISIAKILTVVTLITISVGMARIINLAKIQNTAMMWLYRQKDKQDANKREN